MSEKTLPGKVDSFEPEGSVSPYLISLDAAELRNDYALRIEDKELMSCRHTVWFLHGP